jgi:hypothetical protein
MNAKIRESIVRVQFARLAANFLIPVISENPRLAFLLDHCL